MNCKAMTASIKLSFCLLAVCVGLSLAQAKVSKSFVRGFLVGYAKGLEEGKALAQVHHVACAFHPISEHEPHGPPPDHYHGPPPHHDEHDGYSTNAHSTRANVNGVPQLQTQQTQLTQHQEPRQAGSIPVTSPIDEKKAASQLAIQKAVLDKYRAA